MHGPGTRKGDPRTIAAFLTCVLLGTTVSVIILPGHATATRTLDVGIFDLFNVPAGGFPDYWQVRANTYRKEAVLSNEYPYVFRYTPRPSTDPENFFLYGNYRMHIVGHGLPEMSIDSPVILPRLGKTTTAGGFADVELRMAFLTEARWESLRAAGHALPTWNFNDGWAAELRGTVTMDALGAEKILGLTGDPLAWWSANGLQAQEDWSTWLDTEGNDRLDVYSATRMPFAELFTNLTLTTSGSLIVLGIEHASWGIDALLARWMYWGRADYLAMPPAGFLGFEGRYDRLWLRANLTSTAEVDLLTDVDYGLRAWAATGSVGIADRAAWVWQPTLLDVIPSQPGVNPRSEFDPYAARTYPHLTPGSGYYNRDLYYEYTPAAWNLDAGETLIFSFAGAHPTAFFVPPDGASVRAGLRLGWTTPPLSEHYHPVPRLLRIEGALATGAPSPPDHGYPWIELEMEPGGSGFRRRP